MRFDAALGAGGSCISAWTSIHHEYDYPQEIGAIPSEMTLAAPTPWGAIVFMMNTRRDYVSVPRACFPA